MSNSICGANCAECPFKEACRGCTETNGGTVKFLCDDEMYLGAQVKNIFDDSQKTCFGVLARENFLIV